MLLQKQHSHSTKQGNSHTSVQPSVRLYNNPILTNASKQGKRVEPFRIIAKRNRPHASKLEPSQKRPRQASIPVAIDQDRWAGPKDST